MRRIAALFGQPCLSEITPRAGHLDHVTTVPDQTTLNTLSVAGRIRVLALVIKIMFAPFTQEAR